MKKILLSLTSLALIQSVVLADVVYITARPQPSGAGANPDGTYAEIAIVGSDTSATGTGAGAPVHAGCRFFSNSFSNTTYALSFPNPAVRLTPTLGVVGGIYQIDHNFSSTAGNVSTNISLTVTCSVAGTLSFTNSGTNFIRASGNPANQWKTLGYVTNDIASSTPSIDFYYESGHVSAGANQRLLMDTFRFTLVQPCLSVPVVGVTGPLSTNVNQVVVTGVSGTATNVFVYQDSGAGMVIIGSKLTGVTAGNNTVTVSGLVKNARVSATQKINGQEGCVPTSGLLVGGGANPAIRVTLSLRETASTGPAGTAGSTASANLHFLGATGTSGGAPTNGLIVNPSTSWQTVTFNRGTLRLDNVTGLASTIADGPGYNANDTVTLRVYAYRTGPANGIIFYSPTAAQSTTVTSNDTFSVNWTWNPVADAEGYRLLREVNLNGYTNDYTDVVGVNNLVDANNTWIGGLGVVTPTHSQTNASIQWNPTQSNPTNIATAWAVLDSIALSMDDAAENTGPYDLYIDNLKNGPTTWQTFEGAVSGQTDFAFRAPSFSGTTSGNMLSAPDQGAVSNGASDTGTKSFRVRFQWSGTNVHRWIRLTTSGVGNPQVNLDDDISFRLLLLPVGSSPVAPPAPTLTINQVGADQVLTWTDAHRLQASSLVTGTYTNTGVILAPWTNTFTEPQKFFRLVD
jgi:hypothetical protein